VSSSCKSAVDSSAAETVEGAASAAPSPLPNPVDALYEQLVEMGFLVIETEDAIYRIEKPGVTHNYHLYFQRKNMVAVSGRRFREWHAIDDRDYTRGIKILIAAIISEDSIAFGGDRLSYRQEGSYKLYEMCCGTGVFSRRSVNA